MEIFDLSDETTKINTDEYLISHLYVIIVTVGETAYKFFFESLKELFARLQRENVFTQFRI